MNGLEKHSEPIQIEMTAAHVAVLWDLLFNQLAYLHPNDGPLTEPYRRALWIFCDRLENSLVDLNIDPNPGEEWGRFLEKAKKLLETFPSFEANK